MAVNKHRDHLWVLPEDDANRQLANGFVSNAAVKNVCMDIRPPSGGWLKVLEDFKSQHVRTLRDYPRRHLILLVDFDDDVDGRSERFREEIPPDIADRVYLLGTRNEPERLKVATGKSLESIGRLLAGECADDEDILWGHELVRHNREELVRLRAAVKLFLISS